MSNSAHRRFIPQISRLEKEQIQEAVEEQQDYALQEADRNLDQEDLELLKPVEKD